MIAQLDQLHANVIESRDAFTRQATAISKAAEGVHEQLRGECPPQLRAAFELMAYTLNLQARTLLDTAMTHSIFANAVAECSAAMSTTDTDSDE